MNVDLDKYVRNFRIFYSKVVAGHPQHAGMEKKFKSLVENETSRWRQQLFISKAESSKTSVNSFLNKVKSFQTKSQIEKKKYEWLLETNNFSRAYIFVCIMSLLDVKSKQGIHMIRAHLQNQGVFQEGKFFNGTTLRKVDYGWKKIQKLFANTFNSKPYVSLGQYLNQFPQQFIDVLFDILSDKKVQKIQKGQVTQEKINLLIDIIKTNLTYFEFKNKKIQILIKYGQYKNNINIGYLPDENIYVVSKELPKKQRDDAEGKTLMNLSKISSQLIKMYDSSNAKIKNLGFALSSSQSRDSQIFGLDLPQENKSRLMRKGSLALSMSGV